MIKINLLPSFYLQRRLVRRAQIASVLAAIAIAASFLWYSQRLDKDLVALEEQIRVATPAKQDAERIQAEAQSVRSEIAPIETQVAFCDQAMGMPEKWIAVLKNAAEYTHESVPLTSLSISGSTVTMRGHTPNMRTAARYLLNAMRNPEWTRVQINGPGGYPSGTAQLRWHPRFNTRDYPLSITATLANAPSVPVPPGGGGGGGGYDPGMMGMEPGMPMDPGIAPGAPPDMMGGAPGDAGAPMDPGAPPEAVGGDAAMPPPS